MGWVPVGTIYDPAQGVPNPTPAWIPRLSRADGCFTTGSRVVPLMMEGVLPNGTENRRRRWDLLSRGGSKPMGNLSRMIPVEDVG